MYETAVSFPEHWNESAAAEWAEELFVMRAPEPEVLRHIRRAVRMSLKLAEFWRDPPESMTLDTGEWRARVDIALGARAWRPVLDTARIGLASSPTEELFTEAKNLFRVVHHSFWMEGVSYREWLESAQS